jgi:hypothetical protein
MTLKQRTQFCFQCLEAIPKSKSRRTFEDSVLYMTDTRLFDPSLRLEAVHNHVWIGSAAQDHGYSYLDSTTPCVAFRPHYLCTMFRLVLHSYRLNPDVIYDS